MKALIILTALFFQVDSSKMEHTDTTKVQQDTTCIDSNYSQLIIELEEQDNKIDSLLVLIQQKMEAE